MEHKLLELSAEYAAVKESIDMDPDPTTGHRPRTLDQIAKEYGAVLREFLAG
jgi:chaperone required for assembly of F1-ATPase